MTTPTGDNAFLHDLELTVRAELTLAETSPPEAQAGSMPDADWPDPDAERYDIGLRALLGAVEAAEDATGPGGHPRPPKKAEGAITARHPPGKPGPGISRAPAQQPGRAIE